jgi:hypothetical protein
MRERARKLARSILSNCAMRFVHPDRSCAADPQSVIDKQIENAAEMIEAESLAIPQAGPVCPTVDELAMAISRWHDDAIECGEGAPDFWDECETSERLALYLKNQTSFFRAAAAPPGDAETPARMKEKTAKLIRAMMELRGDPEAADLLIEKVHQVIDEEGAETPGSKGTKA